MICNSKYLPTNISGFYVDKTTGVIINMNNNEERLYRSNIQYEKEKDNLQNQIDDLKQLLQKVLETKING